MKDNTGTGGYYGRWIKDDDKWQLAMDIMSVGEPSDNADSSSPKTTPADGVFAATAKNVTDEIAAKDEEFRKKYNERDFAGVQHLYNTGAELVPPEGTSFVLYKDMATFWKSQYEAGLKEFHDIKPKHVLVESADLAHEIGWQNNTQAAGHYYNRWIQSGGEWEIAFQLVVVGAGG